MKKRGSEKVRYVVCVNASEPDLQLRKIYQVLPDENAEKSKYLRVMDESGEDYLYPEKFFVPIELSAVVEKALQLAS